MSCSTADGYVPQTPNPNPANYEILQYEHVGNHLVISLRYPDCTTYEGRKILVFQNTGIDQLRQQVRIDPHFSESSALRSPIARFAPTHQGWLLALRVARLLPRT